MSELGLTMILVGLTVVFSALIILSWIISLFSKVFHTGKKVKPAVENQASVEVAEITTTEAQESTSDEELIAVLTAAIQASMGRNPECNIRIKSFRRVPQTSPVWNITGRGEYILNKLQ